jgi:hypothetical protein
MTIPRSNGENMNKVKTIRVVDVPADATAEQAEDLLNSICNDGYYFMQFRSTETGALRAFFKLRADSR